jgi:hypothetical protein
MNFGRANRKGLSKRSANDPPRDAEAVAKRRTLLASRAPPRRPLGRRRIEHRTGNETAMKRVILEDHLELITFTTDGRLLHTHKSSFVQRHSLETWPDFESAKKAVETNLNHIKWGEPEE